MATPEPDWPSDSPVPPGGGSWDLAIVGGGTAGLVAAQTAAGFGARVVLVERHLTGGDCLWTGCVPSKSLLAAAHAAARARAAGALGVRIGEVDVDFAAVMGHVHGAIQTIAPVDSPERLRRAGVAVVRGTWTFTGPDSATVDGTRVTFEQALVATGSSPIVPDVPGLVDPLTSDSVWTLETLPERLLVVGGGPIGCELGQGLARLGSQVTIVQSGPRLLARESAAASAAVHRALTADGIDVRTDCTLERIEGDTAHLSDGSTVATGPRGRILVATGRRPGTRGLGLDRAGVSLDSSGFVEVDRHLRTSHPRIWAAGDLTGHPPFTHVAGMHGSLAASNAVLGLRRSVDTDRVPRVTYTQPEVAAFGVGPDDAGHSGHPGHTVRTTPHHEVDRAVAEGDTDGHSSLVLDSHGKVVGASIVGPHAGEMLAEVMLAAQAGLSSRTVAGTMHAYPTWADGVWKGALAQGRADLEKPVVRRLTGGLAAARRQWVRRVPVRD